MKRKPEIVAEIVRLAKKFDEEPFGHRDSRAQRDLCVEFERLKEWVHDRPDPYPHADEAW